MTPAATRRLGLAAAFVLLAALLAHRSSSPTVLARYSPAYFAFLLASLAGAGTLAWLLRRGGARAGARRALQRAQRLASAPLPRGRLRLALLAALALHAILVLRFVTPSVLLSPEPILQVDYAHHFHQVGTVTRALASSGRTWAYDPSFCAGYPEGTLSDVDVKLLEMAVAGLTVLGLALPRAFNAVVVTYFLLPPLVLLLACRSLRLTRRVTLLAVATGVLLWHAHPMLVLFNQSGMCSFVLASYWALLVLALLCRLLERPTSGSAAALAVALAVGFCIHVLAVVLLAGPVLAACVASWWTSPARARALLATAALLGAGANAWWIVPMLRLFPQRARTTYFAPERLSSLVVDLVSFADEGVVLALIGAWGFLELSSRRRLVKVVGVSCIVWFFALALLSGNVPLLRDLEPARFRIPGAIAALVGACCGLGRAFARRPAAPLGRRSVPLLLLCTAFAARLLFPRTPLVPGFHPEGSWMRPLAQWIETHADPGGRIAFMDLSPGHLSGAKLGRLVDRELIGGPFSELALQHGRVTFTKRRFLGVPLSELDAATLLAGTRLYDVRYVITTTAEGARVLSALGALEERARFTLRRTASDDYPVVVFEVPGESRRCLVGSARVEAELNRIEVSGATAGRTVLKYHWLPTFVTQPPLPIRAYPVEGDPIGFIEIDNGRVTDFVLLNGYSWPGGSDPSGAPRRPR